jgi:hypothetical protein
MKSEQAVLPNPCLEEEEEEILISYVFSIYDMKQGDALLL